MQNGFSSFVYTFFNQNLWTTISQEKALKPIKQKFQKV